MSKKKAGSSRRAEPAFTLVIDELEGYAVSIENDLEDFLKRAEREKLEELADRLDEARTAAHALVSCIRDAGNAAAELEKAK